MSDISNQQQITIKPKPQLMRGMLIIFGILLVYPIYCAIRGVMWPNSAVVFDSSLVVLGATLAIGCFLLDQITCYARIGSGKITRVSPIGTWELPLSHITSALIQGSGGRALPILVVRTASRQISFQQLAMSRKDLQKVQSELKQACARVGVNVQTEWPPLNIPVNTIVKFGWLYLLGICAFVGLLVAMGLSR